MSTEAGGDALGDHAHGGLDRGEGFAASELFAYVAVSAVGAEAGDHEVADAAEAVEGFPFAAEGDAEAHHFGEASGDEAGFGVIAHVEAIGDACGDGEDIFEGTAELNPRDVATGVGAEGGEGEQRVEEI